MNQSKNKYKDLTCRNNINTKANAQIEQPNIVIVKQPPKLSQINRSLQNNCAVFSPINQLELLLFICQYQTKRDTPIIYTLHMAVCVCVCVCASTRDFWLHKEKRIF